MSENLVKLNNDTTYVKYKECKAGDVLLHKATFVGTSTSKFGKPNYNFIESNGKRVTLNATGGLTYHFKDIQPSNDKFYKLVYGGKDIMKKGPFAGKEFHAIDVYMYGVNGEEKAQEQTSFDGILP